MSLTYSSEQTSVTTASGQTYPLNQSLVGDMNRPKNGWMAQFVVLGSTVQVNGDNPNLVFAKAKEVFELNSVPFTESGIWLNLNIQWLSRLGNKRPKVRLEELLKIANGTASELIPAAVHRRSYTPKEWGAKGWAMLQMYLAQDVYKFERFVLLADELSNWINPAVNPSIGCGDCYKHYMPALQNLKAKPLHQQEDARMWLFTLMNEINVRNQKPVLSKEQAYQRNFWK